VVGARARVRMKVGTSMVFWRFLGMRCVVLGFVHWAGWPVRRIPCSVDSAEFPYITLKYKLKN